MWEEIFFKRDDKGLPCAICPAYELDVVGLPRVPGEELDEVGLELVASIGEAGDLALLPRSGGLGLGREGYMLRVTERCRATGFGPGAARQVDGVGEEECPYEGDYATWQAEQLVLLQQLVGEAEGMLE